MGCDSPPELGEPSGTDIPSEARLQRSSQQLLLHRGQEQPREGCATAWQLTHPGWCDVVAARNIPGTRDVIRLWGSAGKDLTRSSSWNPKYGRFRLKNQVGSVGMHMGIGEQKNKPS